MLHLLYWQFGSLAVLDVLTFSDIAITVSAQFSLALSVLFKCRFGIFYNYLINFKFNDFIFSITKIITDIHDIVFITRSHIFLLIIHLKFVMEFLVVIFLIGRWSVIRWSVHLAGGHWQVIGWSVGKWSVGRWFQENPFKTPTIK